MACDFYSFINIPKFGIFTINLMIKDTILEKLSFILEQDKKDEILNDKLNSFNYNLVQESHSGKIIFKIIEILYMLFNVKKDERESLYNSDVMEIENKELKTLLAELNVT